MIEDSIFKNDNGRSTSKSFDKFKSSKSNSNNVAINNDYDDENDTFVAGSKNSKKSFWQKLTGRW